MIPIDQNLSCVQRTRGDLLIFPTGKGCSPASKRLLEDFSPFLTRAGDLFLSYAYKFVRNLALKKGEEGAFKEMKRLLVHR